MKPRKPFKWSDALYLAAREHCLAGQRGENRGHISKNGDKPWHRCKRYGTAGCGENMGGHFKSGKMIMMSLF
jgi:uncharacterized protein YkwD